MGLGNVDNTSDIDKPISLATQQALELKATLNHTHSLSDFPGLSSVIEDKANKIHSHAINEVNGLQDALDLCNSATSIWELLLCCLTDVYQ